MYTYIYIYYLLGLKTNTMSWLGLSSSPRWDDWWNPLRVGSIFHGFHRPRNIPMKWDGLPETRNVKKQGKTGKEGQSQVIYGLNGHPHFHWILSEAVQDGGSFLVILWISSEFSAEFRCFFFGDVSNLQKRLEQPEKSIDLGKLLYFTNLNSSTIQGDDCPDIHHHRPGFRSLVEVVIKFTQINEVVKDIGISWRKQG